MNETDQHILNRNNWEYYCRRVASGYIDKIRLLDAEPDFTLDRSVPVKVMADNYYMYKLRVLDDGQLVHRTDDGLRGYEFIIEFDAHDPCIGIYFGCKCLSYGGDQAEDIKLFDAEWKDIEHIVCQVLNNTFPDKDYTKRIKHTNNASNGTYWPFWFSLDEDEDIIVVAATATRLIRNVYRQFVFGLSAAERKKKIQQSIFKRPKKKSNDEVLIPSYTQQAYDALLATIPTEEWRTRFNRLMKNADNQRLIERDHLYEHAYNICIGGDTNLTQFAYLMTTFFDEAGCPTPWNELSRVFINKKGESVKRLLYVSWKKLNPKDTEDSKLFGRLQNEHERDARDTLRKLLPEVEW